MIRTTSALLLLVFAASLHGQIFPRIEKEDVKKRIATGNTETEPDVEQPEDPKPREVDGAAVLKRYNEILEGYLNDERAQKKAMTKHVEEIPSELQDYLEGVFLLRMGFYKDAERKLDDVGTVIKKDSEIKTDVQKQFADDIKSGKAWYFRMMAIVLQGYEGYDTEEEAVAAWRKAAGEGIKMRGELDDLKKQGKLTGKKNVSGQITVWMLTARTEWLELYNAEKGIKDEPGKINSWLNLISATGSKQNKLQEEYTPHYFKQRAALEVVKEFWPDSGYVTGAMADVVLAVNKVGSGQLDNWEAHLEKKPYHTPGGLIVLDTGRKLAGDFKRAIDELKKD